MSVADLLLEGMRSLASPGGLLLVALVTVTAAVTAAADHRRDAFLPRVCFVVGFLAVVVWRQPWVTPTPPSLLRAGSLSWLSLAIGFCWLLVAWSRPWRDRGDVAAVGRWTLAGVAAAACWVVAQTPALAVAYASGSRTVASVAVAAGLALPLAVWSVVVERLIGERTAFALAARVAMVVVAVAVWSGLYQGLAGWLLWRWPSF